MNRQLSLLLLLVIALGGLWLSGCGKSRETPKSTTVISPASSEKETPGDTAAAKQEPTEPAVADEPTPPVAKSPPAEATQPDSAAEEETTPEVAATSAQSAADESSQADAVVAEETADDAKAETTQPDAVVKAEPAENVPAETVVTAYKPASVALGAEPGGTTFKGRVVVKGDLSLPPPIMPGKDPFCIAIGEVPDETLVVGQDQGLANVFVWLRKLPSSADIPPVPEEPVSLDNLKCSFHPHAQVLRVGQSMFIKNSDATGHNTHTSPLRNNAFNQLIPPNDLTGVQVIYHREEILPVTTKCDIHPWMISFHFPIDHPWAAITDENGNFEITGLPAGDLDFRLWHERMGYVERSVKLTLEPGQVEEQTFEVDAAKLKQ